MHTTGHKAQHGLSREARRLSKRIHGLQTEPYPYQWESLVKIELFDGRGLLALDPGLGKSLVSLLYAALHPELRPIVVVCPASVKWHWQNEANHHLGIRCKVLEGRTPYRSDRMYKPNILWAINYDVLQDWLPFLQNLKPKLLIYDECHMLKSLTTKRTRACRKLAKGVKHILTLSGTPLVNRPAELWPTLNILRPDLFPKFVPFATEHCNYRVTPFGPEYKGAKKLPELHAKLSDSVMVRYRRRDVLPDLPPRSDHPVLIKLTDPRGEYDKAVSGYVHWARDYRNLYSPNARNEQVSQLTALKSICGRLKLPAVFDWIDAFLEGCDDKIIVFGWHRANVEAVHARYGKRSVLVHGGVVGKKRQAAFEAFSKGDARILSGNIQAAGVGWPGQAANHVAFIELPWTPGELSQAAARPDRIGQTKPISVYYLLAKETIDEILLDVLRRKQQILTDTLDGGVSRKEDFDVYNQVSEQLQKRAR